MAERWQLDCQGQHEPPQEIVLSYGSLGGDCVCAFVVYLRGLWPWST